MKKRFSKSFLFTLAVLIPLVLLAQNSGPQNYATVIMTFLRAQTAAAARSAIGAGTGGVGSESINFNSTQFTVGAVTNVTIVSGVITTNAVMKGSTSGTITVGATGGIVSSGNTNGFGVASPLTEMHVGSTSTSSPRGIMSAQYSTGTDGARIHMRKARGTEASPTIVSTGDDLGRIMWFGYDGASYLEMASIRAAATGTVTNPNRLPTQLIFSTATDASPSVLTDRVTLLANGNLQVGTGSQEYMLQIGNRLGMTSSGTMYWGVNVASASPDRAGFLSWNTGVAIVGSYSATTDLSFAVNGGTEVARFSQSTKGLGIGTTVPGSFGLAVNHATGQSLDLIYNDSDGSPANHCTLVVSSGGNLTIAPSGGILNVTGALKVSTYIYGNVQSLSGAGAVDVVTPTTEVTTTGAAQALTLADGVAGQEKTIIHGVDGGSFVLTPTTKTGWSTFTSTAAGESITLVYLTTRGWVVKGSYLGVIAP